MIVMQEVAGFAKLQNEITSLAEFLRIQLRSMQPFQHPSTQRASPKVRKLATDLPIRELQTESPGVFGTSKFTFSRDGRWIAVAAGRNVRIYRWPAFTLHRQFEAPTTIWKLASRFGKRIRKTVWPPP